MKKVSAILFRVLIKHPGMTVLLVLSMAASIFFSVLPPLVLGNLIDCLVDNKEISVGPAVLYFVLLAAAGISDSAKEGMITVAGQKMTHALRSELSAKLRRLPASHFIKADPGETSSIMVNDVDTLENLFDSGIVSMIVDAGKLVSIYAVVFTKSRGLGILLLAVMPVLFSYTRHVQKKMLSAQLDNRKAVAGANALIPETLHNIRTIHVFGVEDYMKRRYGESIDNSFAAMEKNNLYDAIYSPVVKTISAAVVAVMMCLSGKGGAFAAFFGMSVGSAVALINYVGNIFDPLESIGMEIQNIQSAIAGIRRVQDFLDLEERMVYEDDVSEECENASVGSEGIYDACSAVCEAVRLDKVCFAYEDGACVLNDLSMEVRSGESVTLAGRTGAGKSTIFRLILGLYAPQKGCVRIYGRDADKLSEKDRRKIFGYVEQNFHAVPGSIKDQVSLADPEVTDEQVEKALSLVGLCDVIEDTDKAFDERDFSQGQIQLLSIARAVVRNPRILLLDEITANLDSITEEKVMNALVSASKDRTVISISHRLYERMEGSRLVMLK